MTIATGFDLGQRSEFDLQSLSLDSALRAKLRPYVALRGARAQDMLRQSPVITTHEACALDRAVKSAHVVRLRLKYDSAEENSTHFTDLPTEAQTVIAPVSFQYGAELDIRAPQFWKAVTAQDWPATIEVLLSFGDAYPTRRKKEADLLARIQ